MSRGPAGCSAWSCDTDYSLNKVKRFGEDDVLRLNVWGAMCLVTYGAREAAGAQAIGWLSCVLVH